MGVTTKNRWPQRIPVKITKKYKEKPGGELICKTFGVNGKCFWMVCIFLFFAVPALQASPSSIQFSDGSCVEWLAAPVVGSNGYSALSLCLWTVKSSFKGKVLVPGFQQNPASVTDSKVMVPLSPPEKMALTVTFSVSCTVLPFLVFVGLLFPSPSLSCPRATGAQLVLLLSDSFASVSRLDFQKKWRDIVQCYGRHHMHSCLRWAKSRDSYRRIARESYRCDLNR